MENEPPAKSTKKFYKDFEATLNFKSTLAFEIAVPVEIEFAGVPQGVSIARSKNNYIEFAAGGRNWPIYVLQVVAGVGVGVLSNYLYDTIKNAMPQPPKTIMIEHEDVRFEHGEMQRMLRDKITIEK